MMPHLVLLGDSVFDNQSYVPVGRSTSDAFETYLPPGWRVTLLAQDGSTIDEIARQLLDLPSDTTHVVLSTGGNDALRDAGILTERAGTVAEALWKLGQVATRFEHRYVDMLRKVRARAPQTLVCTIYNANFGDAHLQLISTTALATFNDAIIRAAWAASCPVIDLRTICDEPEDYANEIEPSARGGEKIARTVLDRIATQA
jgi:GDSL-like Lipase/Acylhydrolase family